MNFCSASASPGFYRKVRSCWNHNVIFFGIGYTNSCLIDGSLIHHCDYKKSLLRFSTSYTACERVLEPGEISPFWLKKIRGAPKFVFPLPPQPEKESIHFILLHVVHVRCWVAIPQRYVQHLHHKLYGSRGSTYFKLSFNFRMLRVWGVCSREVPDSQVCVKFRLSKPSQKKVSWKTPMK